MSIVDIRGEFAAFLQSLLAAKAHWYSIEYLEDDIPSLSSLLKTSQDNIYRIFDLLMFGKISESGSFRFKPDKFEDFLVLFDLSKRCELTHHCVVGYANKKWFIRVGNNNSKALLPPGRRGLPPRIYFVEAVIRRFKNSAIKFAKQSIYNSSTQRTIHTVGKPIIPGDDDTYTFLISQVQSELLPSLFEGQNTLKLNVDASKLENRLFSIIRNVNLKRETELSNILGTVQTTVSPASENRPSFCPTLKRYGVPLEDQRVHDGLLRDLMSLKNKNDQGPRRHLISFSRFNGEKMNLIAIPRSPSYELLRRYAGQTRWINNLLYALSGGEGRENQCLLDLLSYVSRSEEYRVVWEEAVRLNGYPMPKIGEVATKAIQQMANMNKAQMLQLRSCLRMELGSSVFATEYKISKVINLEHIVPITGIYHYGSERIPWSYRSLLRLLELWLATRYEKDSINTRRYKLIDVVINLDHGKGHSRLSVNMIGRYQLEDGQWKEETYPGSLGNARCKKDNSDIIQKTFGQLLNNDIEKLQQRRSIRIMNHTVLDISSDWEGPGGKDDICIPIEVSLASDILLHAMALGKEGSAGWWCTYCQLFKPNWQASGHQRGTLWTIERLKKQAEQVQNLRTPQERMGVKTIPMFPSIPIHRYIIPILHITIGKGNDARTNLCEELQAAAETYTDAYVQAEKDIHTFTLQRQENQNNLASFFMVNREYMKDLKKQKRNSRNLSVEAQDLIIDELDAINQEYETLQDKVKSSQDNLAAAKGRFATAKNAPANSKALGQPVHAKFDEILRHHGIDRSSTFGGAIDGNGCRKMMENADSIINEIQQFVLQHESRIHGISNASIVMVCRAYKIYFQSLDGYISGLSTRRFHVTTEIAEKTRKFRDKCLQLERYLQLSITVKSHLMEAHSCEQQSELQGIGDMGESFGELNHQYQSIADRRHGGTRDFVQRELSKSKEAAQYIHHGVQDKIAEMKEKRKRSTVSTKSNSQKNAEAKRQKQFDDREAALDFVVPTGSVLPKLRDERKRLLLLLDVSNNT